MTLSSIHRGILESDFASLLSLEDGCAEVLDHLLTIESKEDLLEYLKLLLGHNSDAVTKFVNKLVDARRGKDISKYNVITSTSSITPPFHSLPSAKSNDTTTIGKVTKPLLSTNRVYQSMKPPPVNKSPTRSTQPRNRQTQEDRQQQSLQQKQRHLDQEQLNIPNPQFETLKQSHTLEINRIQPKTDTTHVDNKIATHTSSIPKTGKAVVVCGCFGTKHRPLTNCLYCGRISCQKEGYGYCPFCSNLIEEFCKKDDDVNTKDSAWIHKERLLKFDREFVRRTVIYDDQADYYSNSTSAWLTEDEHKDALVEEEKKRKVLHSKEMVLKLGF